MEKNHIVLSKKLKQLLFEHEISQTDLANAIGTSVPTINRIIKSKSKKPSPQLLEDIANFFNISVNQLYEIFTPVTNTIKESKNVWPDGNSTPKKNLSLGQTIKRFLFERDIRPIDLSRGTNIPLPTISRIVTGKSARPTNASLNSIAKYLNMDVSQLTGEENIFPNNLNEIRSIAISQKAKTIPIISWKNLDLEYNNNNLVKKKLIVMDVSEKSFALEMPDFSMEPLFQKGSVLIFDPTVQTNDRSYVLVKLHATNLFVFRQLLIEAEQKIIKSLNLDIGNNNFRLLTPEDKIIARLVEVRNKI